MVAREKRHRPEATAVGLGGGIWLPRPAKAVTHRLRRKRQWAEERECVCGGGVCVRVKFKERESAYACVSRGATVTVFESSKFQLDFNRQLSLLFI